MSCDPWGCTKGILVIEGWAVYGQHWTKHYFGLDFTQNGRSDVVLSDQSAAMPCHALEMNYTSGTLQLGLVLSYWDHYFCHHIKYSIQYSQNYIHSLSCVFFLWFISWRRWRRTNRAFDIRGRSVYRLSISISKPWRSEGLGSARPRRPLVGPDGEGGVRDCWILLTPIMTSTNINQDTDPFSSNDNLKKKRRAAESVSFSDEDETTFPKYLVITSDLGLI